MAEIPVFDSEETARLLSDGLAAHRKAFGGLLGQPAEGPLFRAAPDGAILDRGGRVVAPAPPLSPTGRPAQPAQG